MKVGILNEPDETSATLLGEIVQLIGVSQVDVFFEWGEDDSGYPNTTPKETLSGELPFDFEITGLDPGTDYQFRAVAETPNTTERSDPVFFTTKELEVEVNSATGVEPLSAVLEGEVVTATGINEDIDVGFEIREKKPGATTFPISAGTQQGTGAFDEEATGLKTDTTYEFRATAETSDISKESAFQEFTTDPPRIPVETDDAEDVTETVATLNGELLDLVTETGQASVYFRWGQSVGNNLTAGQTVSQPTEYDVEISNLTQGTTYEYQAVAEFDQTQETGQVRTFTTRILSVETLAATDVRKTRASLNGEITNFAQFDFDATVFFDWGAKGDGLPNTFELDGGFDSPQTFQITLQQLAPGVTYEFQARAEADGVTDTGNVLEFTTKVLEINSLSPQNLTQSSADLQGEVAQKSGFSNPTDVSFEWSEQSGSFGNTLSAGSVTGEQQFSEPLTGLDSGTTYKYRAVGSVANTTDTGFKIVFQTEELEVQTNGESDVALNTATLNGEITSLISDSPATAYFEWGVTNSLSNKTADQSFSSASTFNEGISGLSADTTYKFRAAAEINGTKETGAIQEFTTGSVTIETDPATSISQTDAVLNGELSEFGNFGDDIDVFFEWSLSGGSFGNTAQVGQLSSTQTFSASIGGLQAGEIYKFRAVGEIFGSRFEGATQTFSTQNISVQTVESNSIGETTATLVGDLTTYDGFSTDADVFFEWGEQGQPITSNTLAAGTQGSTGQFNASLSSLSAGTDYQFRAVAESEGERAEGSTLNFSTKNIEVSVNPASEIKATEATLNGSLDTFSGFTDDADVEFEWGEQGQSFPNTENAGTLSSAGSFDSTITGLTPGVDYEYRAKASSEGVSDTSIAETFTTGELSVQTDAATGVQESRATINGTLTAYSGFPENATVFFRWGEQGQGLPNTTQTQSIGTEGASFNKELTGLASNQTYEYRAVAQIVRNGSTFVEDLGTVQTFTTEEVEVQTTSATSIGTDSATLNGELVSYSFSQSSDMKFEYRVDGSNAFTTVDAGDLSSPGTFSTQISNLLQGQTYDFRAFALVPDGSGGQKRVSGTIKEFTTKELEVTSVESRDIGETDATLAGSLTAFSGFSNDADVSFEYREQGASTFTSVAAGTRNDSTEFTETISGLTETTTYEWRAVASAGGITVTGSTKTFSTKQLEVQTDAATAIQPTQANLNGNITALDNIGSVSLSFEYKEQGAPSFTTISAGSTNSTGTFSETVTGLSETTTYEFRALANGTNVSGQGQLLTFDTTSSIDVDTDFASDTNTPSDVTLNGTLSLGDATSADVYFEWRQRNEFPISYLTSQQVTSGLNQLPEGLAFRPDGTKMYVAEEELNTIQQYTLNTSYDILDGSDDNASFDSDNGDYNPVDDDTSYGVTSLAFNDNGSKMFMNAYDQFSSGIFEYDLSTNYDLSSASYSGNFFNLIGITNEDQSQEVIFNDDGTKLFTSGINEFNLGTAYDITTMSNANNLTNPDSDIITSIDFNNDGTRIYVSYRTYVKQYDLPNPYDLSNLTYAGTLLTPDATISPPQPTSTILPSNSGFESVKVRNGGNSIFAIVTPENAVYSYDLASSYDITSVQNLNSNGTFPQSLSLNQTPMQTLSSSVSFSDTVTLPFDHEYQYEYRAVGETPGITDFGTFVNFTTVV